MDRETESWIHGGSNPHLEKAVTSPSLKKAPRMYVGLEFPGQRSVGWADGGRRYSEFPSGIRLPSPAGRKDNLIKTNNSRS
jgi:hypothetical protein